MEGVFESLFFCLFLFPIPVPGYRDWEGPNREDFFYRSSSKKKTKLRLTDEFVASLFAHLFYHSRYRAGMGGGNTLGREEKGYVKSMHPKRMNIFWLSQERF